MKYSGVRTERVGLGLAVAVSASLCLGASQAGGVRRTFDQDRVGAVPPGFTFAEARKAAPERWIVRRDENHNVLAHLGEPGDHGFALALLQGPEYMRVSVSVRLRLTGGGRSAGLVWRVRDPDNYYLARLDLNDQDISLYRVVGGNRVRIEREDDLELDPEAWHTLKILQRDQTTRVYLGGIRVFEARDRTFQTPGTVGLWSTGDSVAEFDDFRVEIVDERGR
jgi:hypothetical protein